MQKGKPGQNVPQYASAFFWTESHVHGNAAISRRRPTSLEQISN